MRYLAVLFVIVAACSPPTSAPSSLAKASALPTSASSIAPTPTSYAGTGVIEFGRNYDRSTGLIIGTKSTFSRTVDKIAWSASLSEEPATTKLTLNISRENASGAERLVHTEKTTLANPETHRLSQVFDLAGLLNHRAGTYVMRYIRGGTVLAEGRFTLR